jgi:hypothetical protein
MEKKIHKRGTPVGEKKGQKKTREKGGEHDTLVIETESMKAFTKKQGRGRVILTAANNRGSYIICSYNSC